MVLSSVFQLPLGALLALLIALLLVTVEIGRRLGERDRARHDTDSRSHASALHAGLIGLMALLLGFAFSLAAAHFVQNRDLVAEEANAIDTAYRRADLVVEPERGALRESLRRYVDARITFFGEGITQERRHAADEDSRQIHATLWRQAAIAAARNPTCTTALLVEAVNRVIELHETRIDASRNHVPSVILWMLVLMSTAATGLTGYVSGLGDRRPMMPAVLMLVLVASVLVVIVDLDRPLRGLSHGGQPSLQQVRRMMEAGPAS